MKSQAARLGACAALASALLVGVPACPDALAQATSRDLASAQEVSAKAALIAESARHRTGADRAAARELISEGDAAYRAGRYDAAHSDYDNASANAPNAYAYLMTGDAHWRAALASARQPAAVGDASACRMQRLHFVDDLRLDLNQQYLVGLRLAQSTKLPPVPDSALRARAQSSAACLARLADEYEPLPPQTCVDDARIARCLGAPLIK